MAYGKGRATGYTDYYKNNSSTPGAAYDGDDEEDSAVKKTKLPVDRVTRPQLPTTKTTDDKEVARKAALRRRLQIKKARM